MGQEIDSGLHIFQLAHTPVVLAFAQSSASEVKPQNGNTQRIQCFGHLKNNFVVHGSTEKGVWMADHRRNSRRRSWRSPKNSL
jgi:hypothetical protein